MSSYSTDILDSFVPVSYKKSSKKRKAASPAAISATNSDNENATSSQNAAYYMQLAVDNLMLALEKETDSFVTTKIQFLLTKAQHLLLNSADNADFESDSQSDLCNLIQTIKSDITVRFNEIQSLIKDLQFVNIPAAGSFNLAEPAIANSAASAANIAATSSAATSTANLTENNSLNSHSNSGKRTWAQTAAIGQGLHENCGSSLNKADEKRSNSARS